MSYQALARKWRPQTFDDMLGQQHVLQALRNALDHDRLHHAYLFTGTRGVGKTTVARVLARALNCEEGVSSTPCGVCSACRSITEGRFVDLIEVDAASKTKVEDTRELLENVAYAPTQGRYKVYLIDEVHMFSKSSFNALLKTLEEPPDHVKFLLATTEPKKIPVTIMSRCLQFNLKRLPEADLAGHLRKILEAEAVTFEASATDLLAMAADGSVRDSLSLLDQALAFGGGELCESVVREMLGTMARDVSVELLETLATGDVDAMLSVVARIADQAVDIDAVLVDMLRILQRLALAHLQQDFEASREGRLAKAISPEDCQLMYQVALAGRRDLDLAPDPRVGLEMTLIRMHAFRLVEPGEIPDFGSGVGSDEVPPEPARQDDTVGVASALLQPAPVALASANPAESEAPEPAGPPVAAVAVTTAGDAPDWAAVIDELRIGGLARQLARQCAISRWQGGAVELVLQEKDAELHTEAAQRKLREALSTRAGQPVRLSITHASTSVDSPAAREIAAADAAQREAARAIADDPAVRLLCERFDAVVESTSPVTPDDTATRH